MAVPNKKLRATMKPPSTSVPKLLENRNTRISQGTPPSTTTTNTNTTAAKEDQPFLEALRQKQVTAVVMHLDHYRSNPMSVSTDYIILVHPYNPLNDDAHTNNHNANDNDKDPFDSFTLSKKYSDFRVFAQELTKIADRATAVGKLSAGAAKLIKYIELVSNLIDSQSPKFLGKVSFQYVQSLAKQRRQIINGVLDATCEYFPSHIPQPCQTMSDILIADVAAMISNFFLTDIVIFNGLKQSGPRAKIAASKNPKATTDNPILNPLVGLLNVFDGNTNNADEDNTDDGDNTTNSQTTSEVSPRRRSSAIVPLSVKDRRSEETRNLDKQALEQVGEEAQLFMLDDGGGNLLDAPPAVFPMSPLDNQTRTTDMIRDVIAQNRWLWYSVGLGLLVLVSRASAFTITVDGDWGLLVLFAAYCLGMHTPRPAPKAVRTPAIVRTTHLPDRSGRRLIRRSLIRTASSKKQRVVQEVDATTAKLVAQSSPPRIHSPHLSNIPGDDDEPEIVQEVVMEFDAEEEHPVGPMKQFPVGAELGSILNCWGHSVHTDFKIRGANYLHDRKKIPSQDFLFPVRGCDLFLTDTCPSNVGRNPAMFGGCLREKPTFIINFRLPWGVKVGYYEIPTKFIPFIQASFEPESADMNALKKTMDSMPPGERCLARFLQADSKTKNKALKIVPVVVKGPWVVRQVVGGKPAIVGNKLPITYTYQKAEGDKAMYLEADLDIAASSAARTILSVARTYTQVLTLDLGFVVQGNSEDELPEQMLCGCRLHGIDPLSAPSFPPDPVEQNFQNMGSSNSTSDSDDGSVTPMPREE